MGMATAKRILLLVHPKFIPNQTKASVSTETDVWRSLRRLGHEVEYCALDETLGPLDQKLSQFRPHVVFNLLEEFKGESIFDFSVISFLEAKGVAFTGCNPRALVLTRNKLWTGQIAGQSGYLVPEAEILKSTKSRIEYPVFLKFNREHASLGITSSNVVLNSKALHTVVRRMRRLYSGEILAQQFIPGKEVSVSVLGNNKARAFQPWVLHLPAPTDVATERVKFSAQYRLQRGIRAKRFLPAGLAAKLCRQSEGMFKLFDMNGYARFDYRIDLKGRPYLIDVNANPNLARTEDFAASAKHSGLPYDELIEQIINLGLRYKPNH
jgi:D-alanine-D-alanine ligase